jgi:hypothetical protein
MPGRPDVRAHIQTRPDIRGQRPPHRTSEVSTHRTFSPRTVARFDAQPRRRTRRDGRHGRPRARPTHQIPRPHHLQDLYGTGMRRFTVFGDEEGITPLQATAGGMLRFTIKLARVGTVAASNLQPYSQRSTSSFATTLRSR